MFVILFVLDFLNLGFVFNSIFFKKLKDILNKLHEGDFNYLY